MKTGRHCWSDCDQPVVNGGFTTHDVHVLRNSWIVYILRILTKNLIRHRLMSWWCLFPRLVLVWRFAPVCFNIKEYTLLYLKLTLYNLYIYNIYVNPPRTFVLLLVHNYYYTLRYMWGTGEIISSSTPRGRVFKVPPVVITRRIFGSWTVSLLFFLFECLKTYTTVYNLLFLKRRRRKKWFHTKPWFKRQKRDELKILW